MMFDSGIVFTWETLWKMGRSLGDAGARTIELLPNCGVGGIVFTLRSLGDAGTRTPELLLSCGIIDVGGIVFTLRSLGDAGSYELLPNCGIIEVGGCLL